MSNRPQSHDHKLLAVVISLLALGLVMVFSASAGSALAKSQNKFLVIRSQVMWAIVGLGGMAFTARLDYRNLRGLSLPMLVTSIGLLLMVFVPGVGVTRGGAQRWLGLGGFTFQPSELAKMALVLFLADSLSSKTQEDRGNFWRFVVPPMVVIGAMAACVLRQPNLSYTIILSSVGFLMIGLLYRHWMHMLSLGLAGIATASGGSWPSWIPGPTPTARAGTSSSRSTRSAAVGSGAWASGGAGRSSSTYPRSIRTTSSPSWARSSASSGPPRC